ncbi:methyltransferase family protein [Rhizomicrobium electricum]|uniref:Isoprenylcysteine carboxylmethyltransferase family protein n=1 Tax=Rhizomicrobium electricum TaxID=480070 RepID=A0ABN1F5K4_9PROT|nr:isoprenylcysteine carboxylmethyltransferase family protein [Rhizomicrobium electricum]NIJ49429.1 protein-S-isoprenylcysteine O-methyltransferase Ste14 [Rhizomicrobium electricum]
MEGSDKLRAAPAAISRQAAILDLCERGFVLILFLRFAWAMLSGQVRTAHLLDILLVVSEAIPIVLIMLRARSETLSRRPTDWLLGLLGSALPPMVRPVVVVPLAPASVCFVIMVTGTFLQLAAKIVLGRRFGVVAANRGVVTLGPYRFIRHPMYLGYTITHIGFLLSMPSLTTLLLYMATLTVQIMRILREETVLMRDEAYRDFAGRVHYRLLPGVF